MSTRLFGAGSEVLYDRSYQLLLSASFTSVMGLAVVSPILERLMGPFGASAAAIGLVLTASSAPGIVLIPLNGFLMDRYGRKPILVAGLLLFGGAGAAIAATTDFRVVLGLRVLQGAGLAGINPVIITSIGDLYTGEEEAAGQGMRMVMTGLSLATFPVAAGLLVGLAWQLPFLLYAIAIPVAVLIYLFFEEPMGTREASVTARADRDDDAYVRELIGLATRVRVAAILLARPFSVVAAFGLFTYNSLVVVRVLSGSAGEAGLVVAANSVFQAGMSTQVGRISATFEDPTVPLLAANVCMGGGATLFAFAPSLPVAVLGAVIVGLGGGIAFPLYRSVITRLSPEAFRGGLVSIAEASNRVAVTLVPVVLGAAIAVLEPLLGFAAAIRLTIGGAGVIGGALALLCVLIARTSGGGVPATEPDGPTG